MSRITNACLAALLAIALAAPLAPAMAAEPTPLPAHALRLGCWGGDAPVTAQEVAAIQDLMTFAEDNDGRPVYLDAVITADAGAGGCRRDYTGKAKRPAPTEDGAVIVMDRCESKALCWRQGLLQITANGPPMVIEHSIILPRPEDLPESLPYRMGGYGDWLNYQGPFIVRFHSGTGYVYVTFTPPDPALVDVWRRAACNADPAACR
ncbi:MAG: hypothetical protein Q8L66_08290 [Caulobacter sp.]|nr:hypothetical protein [Caulobacter sp.]